MCPPPGCRLPLLRRHHGGPHLKPLTQVLQQPTQPNADHHRTLHLPVSRPTTTHPSQGLNNHDTSKPSPCRDSAQSLLIIVRLLPLLDCRRHCCRSSAFQAMVTPRRRPFDLAHTVSILSPDFATLTSIRPAGRDPAAPSYPPPPPSNPLVIRRVRRPPLEESHESHMLTRSLDLSGSSWTPGHQRHQPMKYPLP